MIEVIFTENYLVNKVTIGILIGIPFFLFFLGCSLPNTWYDSMAHKVSRKGMKGPPLESGGGPVKKRSMRQQLRDIKRLLQKVCYVPVLMVFDRSSFISF